MDNTERTPNQLTNESSPYLLQHAYNPVNWYPWGDAALQKAEKENKPMLVSIGYSACHWCHVMERESFENEEIAAIMNREFINIKVDREERPDVDHIYMEAIQAMGVNGGWPLNVFLTPDAQPFYGGTYFPPQQFGNLLLQVAKAFKEHRSELVESARKFTSAISTSELERYGIQPHTGSDFPPAELETMFTGMARKFDAKKGGMQGAPKFPMPAIYDFLLRYHAMTGNEQAWRQARQTLDKMAQGGIYDQLGGGFARYSVDNRWFAPHFEKMLYDNGQLLSVYAFASKREPRPLYRKVAAQTISFVKRELTSEEGGFYSALDADSEGMEGRFYVWTWAELQQTLGEDTPLIANYYQATEEGNWEHGFNILHVNTSPEAYAQSVGLKPEAFAEKLATAEEKLMRAREQRPRPGLDDKILASWNGLMLKGLCDAYAAFGEPAWLQMAEKNACFLDEKITGEGFLYHNYKNGKASIKGYLEDYAAVIQGYLALYEASFEEKWLQKAEKLALYTLQNFWDEKEGLFFFTDAEGEQLIARKKEIFDNVIPSSNSVMATNLYTLGLLLDKREYVEKSREMLNRVRKMLEGEARYLANWGSLFVRMAADATEVAIVGKEYRQFAQQLCRLFHHNLLLVGTATESKLPLLELRQALDGKTTLFVCRNKACQMPVHTVEEAVLQIREEAAG